ncbi:MAG TPA: Smr/MutS family protein, partial [Savagea sp.]
LANTIEFGDAVTTIVITGPNTGGKTVTLKTVGLCTLMAQAGIPIPVLDGSEIAVFHSIYADIGDEQSIEQSLSTFSSHMVNIVDILKKFDERSLLLFDELGSGTDPQEGAALAISILDEVHGTGARVMATTHYPELKAYGYNRQGVANASVEFDIDTLSPTYRLLIGVPGRSNAFEISDRLGLNRHIIDRAKKFTGTDSGEVNEMIASLETSRIHAEKDREQMAIQLAEAEQLRRDLEKELEEIQKNEQRLLEKATEKAEKIVRKASEESEAIMTELRNLRMHTSAQVKEHELIEMKKRLNQAQPKRVNQPKEKKVETRPLKIGDEVKSLDYGQTGTLIDQLDTGDWVVQIGILKMNLPESRLEYIRPKKEKMKSVTTVKRSSAPIKMELDLRGLRYEEAIQRTEKYIDDALLANLHQIHIIHGKGTGALREGVQTLLKRHSRVKNYRFGEAGEGGFGVTVAELK